MAVREPGDSGDGLVAVGAVGEAVWIDGGMDASAEALMTALPSTRTVPSHAIPEERGEVGLVAEYALIPLLADGGGTAAATVRDATLLAGSDYSVVMRYTWLPTVEATENPALTEPLERVLSALTGEESDDALAELVSAVRTAGPAGSVRAASGAYGGSARSPGSPQRRPRLRSLVHRRPQVRSARRHRRLRFDVERGSRIRMRRCSTSSRAAPASSSISCPTTPNLPCGSSARCWSRRATIGRWWLVDLSTPHRDSA